MLRICCLMLRICCLMLRICCLMLRTCCLMLRPIVWHRCLCLWPAAMGWQACSAGWPPQHQTGAACSGAVLQEAPRGPAGPNARRSRSCAGPGPVPDMAPPAAPPDISIGSATPTPARQTGGTPTQHHNTTMYSSLVL